METHQGNLSPLENMGGSSIIATGEMVSAKFGSKYIQKGIEKWQDSKSLRQTSDTELSSDVGTTQAKKEILDEGGNTANSKPDSVEVTISYKNEGKFDANEFNRQVMEDQKVGLQSMRAGEIKEGIESYKLNGRPPLANKTTRDTRKANPEVGSDQAVTHSPDCCLGNPGDKITGFGDTKINSSIGSQNRRNQKEVYEAIKDAPKDADVKVKLIVNDKLLE